MFCMSQKEHISGSGFTNIRIWLGGTALSNPSYPFKGVVHTKMKNQFQTHMLLFFSGKIIFRANCYTALVS